jgi:hypothetical protein
MPMVEFEIKSNTDSLAERRAAQKQRQLVTKIIAATTIAVVVIVGGIVISQLSRSSVDAPSAPHSVAQGPEKLPGLSDANSTAPTGAAPRAGNPPSASSPERLLVADDGTSIWVSPTSGPPLALFHLPGDSQLLLILRPAALQATGEMDRLVTSLGPYGEHGLRAVEAATGRRWDTIDQLVIAFQLKPDSAPDVVLVVNPHGTQQEVKTLPGYEVWRPEAEGNAYVVATPAMIAELKDIATGRATLRRDFEELLTRSDSDRHLTLLMTNSVVGSPTLPLWTGPFARLREAVFAWLPDQTQAFALSLHWDDRFFMELRLVATLDQRPEIFAERLRAKVATWPALAEEKVTSLVPQPYGRKVVARLPAMLREVGRYVRAGRDQRFALLRCYLPRAAGHNLIMAGELVLAESFAGPPAIAAGSRPEPATLAERLQAHTSLSFARDTLETALQLLAEDAGISIELEGGDLQLDGITKNQSFGLDLHDRPVGEILVSILQQANPDKTASGPADPKQKLVYVVVNEVDGAQTIKVTTRSQAEKRGETLPRVFVQ